MQIIKKYCANCKGPHPADSERCPLIREQTYNNNKFILKVLLGEGVIKSKEQILRVKPIDDIFDNTDLKGYVDSQINQLKDQLKKQEDNTRSAHLKLEHRVSTIESKTDELVVKLGSVVDDVGACKIGILNLGEKINEGTARYESLLNKNNHILMQQFAELLNGNNHISKHSSNTPPHSPVALNTINLNGSLQPNGLNSSVI